MVCFIAGSRRPAFPSVGIPVEARLPVGRWVGLAFHGPAASQKKWSGVESVGLGFADGGAYGPHWAARCTIPPKPHTQYDCRLATEDLGPTWSLTLLATAREADPLRQGYPDQAQCPDAPARCRADDQSRPADPSLASRPGLPDVFSGSWPGGKRAMAAACPNWSNECDNLGCRGGFASGSHHRSTSNVMAVSADLTSRRTKSPDW